MTVFFDEVAETFAIMPDRCPDCVDQDDPAYQKGGTHEHYGWRDDTGCNAPGCPAARWDCCGTGCDAGFPGSKCDAAYEAESEDERLARINKERAVFGMDPLTKEGNSTGWVPWEEDK